MLEREEELFYAECGVVLEQAVHRSCGYHITRIVQGQAGLGSERPDLVKDVATHGRGDLQRSFPIKTLL